MVVLDNHGVSGFGARDPRDTDVLDVARHVGGRHARDGRVGPWQTKRGLRLVDVVDCDPLEGRVALYHGTGEHGGEGERECEEGEMHGERGVWWGVICGVVVVELGVYIAITPPPPFGGVPKVPETTARSGGRRPSCGESVGKIPDRGVGEAVEMGSLIYFRSWDEDLHRRV